MGLYWRWPTEELWTLPVYFPFQQTNGRFLTMNNICVLLFAAVFVVAIHQGSSIKCYVCNDIDQKGSCPKGLQLTECNSTDKYCRKIEQEINIDDEDTTRTIYQCATELSTDAPNGECLQRTGTYRFKSWYCECDTDGCNSAGTAAVSIVLSTVALFVSLYKNL